MNRKCTINPQVIIGFNFKHIFTYRLLYHIMVYYDADSRRVYIDKDDIVLRYGSNYTAVRKGIKELLENGVIIRYNEFKNMYKINHKVFIDFESGITEI